MFIELNLTSDFHQCNINCRHYYTVSKVDKKDLQTLPFFDVYKYSSFRN